METGTPAPGPFEARYHNAMPGWVKIKGLDIKSIDQCEGGGFAIREDHWRAITQASAELTQARAQVAQLRGALDSAKGYLLNAKIDLETGAPKRTAIQTIDGGLKHIQIAIDGTPVIPSSPDINGEMLEALRRVGHTLGVHGHIDGGTDLHAFIEGVIARAQSQPSTTGEG